MATFPTTAAHPTVGVGPVADLPRRLVDEGGSNAADSRNGARAIWAKHPDQRIRGVWWPRSRNVDVELAQLLSAADMHLGAPLTRLWLNPATWDHQPRRLYTRRRMIRLAWFTSMDPATSAIGATPLDRISLVVIPPDCPAAAGQRIFRRLRDCDAWPTESAETLAFGTSTEART
jgi:hypothetical protein